MRSDPHIHSVFTYGTLMLDDVFQKVCHTRHPKSQAILKHYQRVSLKNRVYPAAIPSKTSQITGILWQSISSDTLARLDEFEGKEYNRIAVIVKANTGTQAQAWCYVLTHSYRHLAGPEAWSLEQFQHTYETQLNRSTTF